MAPVIKKTQTDKKMRDNFKLKYFPTDNAHPKLFYIPFEVQITRT